ncbi:helix-turn-helix domain-containing protein [Sinorhizobium meliloti]
MISAFDTDNDKMTLAEVARRTDMPRAGARRLLLTLHALGYVTTDGKLFSLAPKVLELGFSFLSSKSWISVATPLLEKLRDELGESVSVTALEGDEVVYLARFPVDRVMTMSMKVGARRPAYCTAMGRVLLGELGDDELTELIARADIRKLTSNTITDRQALKAICKKVRAQGHALVCEELEQGLVAISVPLRSPRGEALAAVNVCGHPSNLTVTDLEGRCLRALKRTVRLIEQSIV